MREGEVVLVTGAAGTVGAYIVEELLGQGRRVVATDRAGSRFESRFESGFEQVAAQKTDGAGALEIREGDLTDARFAERVLAGVTDVIHTAAVIDGTLPATVMRAVNVDAVRALFDAARAHGCRRFVHFSSGSIYSKSRDLPGLIDEQRAFAPQTEYERSKADAERWLWSQPHDATELVVVRPTMIYGPRARFFGAKAATLPPLLALALGKVPRVVGGPVCNWVHAHDVARAAVFLLDAPDAAWQAFNVADETPMSFGAVIEAITRSYGYPVGRDVPYPTRAARLLGPMLARQPLAMRAMSAVTSVAWAELARRHDLRHELEATVDQETLLYSATDAIFDTDKLNRLGFRVRWKSLAEGYPDVLRWFQAHRWLPTPAAEDAVRPSLALRFRETMAGTWRPAGAPYERDFRFTVAVRADDLGQLVRDGRLELAGRLDAAGLATDRACAGSLTLSLRGGARLAYDLAFAGDDGRAYRFAGAKRLRLLHLARTMTTLPGRVTDNRGASQGDCQLRFDLRHDLLDFLASFRLERRRVATVDEEPEMTESMRSAG